MTTFTLSLLLIVLAAFFQGTFGLGYKKYAPLAWEVYWLIYSLIGMVVVPYVWASLTVPDVFGAISSLPSRNLVQALVYGGCWGVGAIMFGLSVNYIGVALVYGISMGLGAAMGSLLPLAEVPEASSHPAFPYIILGVIVLLVGIVLLTVAGVKREASQKETGSVISGIRQGKWFRLGLLFSILNGVFTALLNVGFTKALPASEAAIEQGAVPRNASLVAWLIVMVGGFVVNLIYSLYQMVKNKSYVTVVQCGSYRGILWAVGTAILFFAALGVYGQGAAIMGELGPVIGWPMFLGLALIISNLWGMFSGEWKGVKKAYRLLIVGDVVLIVSWMILGYANQLMQ